jgi:hypothetical protein
VSAASAWSLAANMEFDFGPPGTYREWTRNDTTYAARIRIAFDEEGYWSFVGSAVSTPPLPRQIRRR